MNPFTIKFNRVDNNKTKLVKSFATKKEANKLIKDLVKGGRVSKRGYDYFTTSLNFELQLNY